MTTSTLIRRSLRFHWRSHLGVVLGAAVGSAALIGALIVGDSVRQTLRDTALARLGPIHFAIDTGDRLFRSRMASEGIFRSLAPSPNLVTSVAQTLSQIQQARLTGQLPAQSSSNAQTIQVWRTADGQTMWVTQGVRSIVFSPTPSGTNYSARAATALRVPATVALPDGSARANHVQLLGVDDLFAALANSQSLSNIPPDSIVLNAALASHLNVKTGDTVVLRAHKLDAMSGDSPVAPKDNAVVLRLTVRAIASAAKLGNFSLVANQVPPFNAFVNLEMLQAKLDTPVTRGNLLVSTAVKEIYRSPPGWIDRWLSKSAWLSKWSRSSALFKSRRTAVSNDIPVDVAVDKITRALVTQISMADLQFDTQALQNDRGVDLRSPRIFLDPPFADAIIAADTASRTNGLPLFPVKPVRVLTYLVNQLKSGTNTTPYSMVAATDSPMLPQDLRDNEIVITQWLADDLEIGVGAEIELSYFLLEHAAQLAEGTNRFRVRAVLPMDHPLADRSLMPDFPGVAKAEHAGDWDTSFPLVHTIRPKDDEYWRTYRGTPKAFMTLAAGQRLWANRFGNVTAIRFPFPTNHQPAFTFLRTTEITETIRNVFSAMVGRPQSYGRTLSGVKPISLAELGFQIRPVHEEALAAATQSQDFGGLFIGFSFFLIIAALILMALLFQFGVEQRVTETGTLLALGFRARQVRRLFLLEGAALAFIGGMIGVVGGIVYARAMLRGLTTIWQSAVNTAALNYHASIESLVIGLLTSVLVAVVTIWLVLRKQARQPARELLTADWSADDLVRASRETKDLGKRNRLRFWTRLFSSRIIAPGASIAAIGIIGAAFATGESSNPEYFFSAGSLWLIAGLSFAAALLARLLRREAKKQFTLNSLGVRGSARRRKRSLATIALLASGVFLIVSIGAFRLDSERDAWKRSSGTGGFALIGESTLPALKDLNTREGRDLFALDEKKLEGVSFVPMRVKDGDDASCLNLNRAQQPRLLGVNPELLAKRDAFTFAQIDKQLSVHPRWRRLLSAKLPDDAIPAIGDAASIQWALGKKIGDTLTYRDERGNEFKVRLVAGLANSVLQGSLIIDEAEFVKRFPGVSGYRMFLIDAPSNSVPQVSAELSRALQDVGFEGTSAAQRLAAFNAVQNTYLNTFQVLGGLGLLLGSAGLGIVVLRNVLERRGELALLIAVGFRRRSLQRLVLTEHAALLFAGLAIGILSAAVAVLPTLLSRQGDLPLLSLTLTLGGVLLFGLASTWLATRIAIRGNLLEGLRNE